MKCKYEKCVFRDVYFSVNEAIAKRFNMEIDRPKFCIADLISAAFSYAIRDVVKGVKE